VKSESTPKDGTPAGPCSNCKLAHPWSRCPRNKESPTYRENSARYLGQPHPITLHPDGYNLGDENGEKQLWNLWMACEMPQTTEEWKERLSDSAKVNAKMQEILENKKKKGWGNRGTGGPRA